MERNAGRNYDEMCSNRENLLPASTFIAKKYIYTNAKVEGKTFRNELFPDIAPSNQENGIRRHADSLSQPRNVTVTRHAVTLPIHTVESR
eukprot:1186511-Amorphochlora_amoeboformis.AAC.1